MNKYKSLSKLQGAVLVAAPVAVIFATADALHTSGNQPATIEAGDLIRELYHEDGSPRKSQADVARALGVTRGAVNQRWCWVLRRLRHELTAECTT